MLQDNLPPLIDEKKPAGLEQSLRVFVRYGKAYGEHGAGKTRKGQSDHLVTFDLGAEAGLVAELRVVDQRFFSPQTYTVFITRNGERIDAGKATPHEDGKGYRWPIMHRLEDGESVELQPDRSVDAKGGRGPTTKRRPKPKAPRW